jgi:hypothetical protein
MNEPDRLLTLGATDFERRVLGSWESRQPSEGARAKVLAAAGAVAATSAVLTATAKAGGSVAPKAIAASSSLFMKWLVVGLVGATLVGGSVEYLRHSRLADPVAQVSAPPAPELGESSLPASGTQPAAAVPAPVDGTEIELAGRPGPGAPVPRSKASPAAPFDHKSTLDDEVTLIDQARRALASKDASSALQLVSSYDVKYPAGSLSQEATAIRIEALVLLGNRAAAERLATRFIASHPSSPYVHKIRALVSP